MTPTSHVPSASTASADPTAKAGSVVPTGAAGAMGAAGSVGSAGDGDPRDGATPVLAVRGLTKVFRARRRLLGRGGADVHAATDVSFTIGAGETMALVGESGSGKSTIARLVVQLERADAGVVEVFGQDWTQLRGAALRRQRPRVQMVFQDPFASLNPMRMVLHIVGEPLMAHRDLGGAALDREVAELLDLVGLPPSAASRYPHEFSGGQRQRIAIARALAAQPDLLIADEAVSALDVSTQAQVLNLLNEIQRRRQVAMLFISHDLGVVRQVADHLAVLYLGRIVESGPADEVFATPTHPYTRALLAAVPRVGRSAHPDHGQAATHGGAATDDLATTGGPSRTTVPGLDPQEAAEAAAAAVGAQAVSATALPPGCAYAPRCPERIERCTTEPPALLAVGELAVACHRAEELMPVAVTPRPTSTEQRAAPATTMGPGATGAGHEPRPSDPMAAAPSTPGAPTTPEPEPRPEGTAR